jgi:stage II sporulation protein R
MRVIRDVTFAMVLGILGGLVVTVASYYNDHKEGGVMNTLLAVANSAQTISDAYSDTEDKGYNWNVDPNLLAGGRVTSDSGEFIDQKIPALSDAVLAAFNNVTGASADDMVKGKKSLTVFDAPGRENDVVAVNDDLNTKAPYADIMRFHVRANSDSDEDQELKMAVRDDVVSMLKPLLSECGSVARSKEVIISNLQNIYETAVNTITEQGYDYPVKVYVTVEDFPAKAYGDLTFPAGKYQALRIDIGNALGKNWWCVMYPPLCFIDDATAVVSDEGKELLRENLSEKEYLALLNDPETNIKGESAIYNYIKDFFDKKLSR